MKITMTQFLKVALIAIMYVVSVNVSGQIQINNEAGLRAIADNLAGDYILTDDITLTEDWIPVGNDQDRFTGTINGNGKTIYGLKTVDTSKDGVGFIGVAEGATIENLSIVGMRFYGAQAVGGVAGRAYAPTYVEKCYTSGVVSGWDHIGGIIGSSKASNPEGEFSVIDNCFSTAAVISTDHQAGGIVGAAIDISVENSYFAGVAQCVYNRTGGIIALVDGGSASIQNCVVMAGFLKGADDRTNRILGGIMDNTFCDLYNNYSWEDTEVYQDNVLYTDGESNANGLDGEHATAATLKSASFYTGTLRWNNPVWKIENGNYPIFSYHSYPLDGDGIYVPLFPDRAMPGNTFNAGAVSALNRAVAYSSSDPSVASIDNQGLVSFIKDGTTTLTFSTQGDANYNGATLTIELRVQGISYQITTEEDLRNIKYDLEGEFTLMNNITLTGNWDLFGTFKGKLNGNGHIIYGLKYNDRNRNDVGLFATAEGAVITKLGIEKAEITGNADVGAIVGTARGCIISECYVADSYIAGRDHIGSIVGAMRDYEKVITPGDPDQGIEEVKEKIFTTVRDCHSGAQIYSREYQAGGIAGIICGGTLENCYFSGVVQATQGRAAGIVSLVDNGDPGEIKNNINMAAGIYCNETYRIGDWGGRGPESDNYATKFINNWSVQNSYLGSSYDLSAVKTSQNAEDRDGRTVTTESQARTQSFYTSTLGWDFTGTWKYVAGTDGKMYPILKWQEPPLFSKVYGIPENPHLIYPDPNGFLEIDLSRIIPTYGQELQFTITEGANFVEKEGNKYFVTERLISEGGWTKFAITLKESSLADLFAMEIPKLDVEIILTTQVFELKTPADIVAMNSKPFAKFLLMNDINMAGVEFEGIGSPDTPFTGELDGNGYTISNAKVKVTDENKKGFFNVTRGATIKKLGLSNFSFSGSVVSGSDTSVDLGGLVGSCKNTTIDQCYVTGKIVGRDHVGGLIGGDCDNVTVSNTYVDVVVDAGSQAGGFFGVTAGDNISVGNSYFAGSVTATTRGWIGGIIGLIDRAGDIKISGCASIGDLSCVEKTGYFIGQNGAYDGNLGTVSQFYNNIYNYDAEFRGEEEWFIASTVPGTIDYPGGKSSGQLKQQATYTAIGWDFNDIWTITEGQTYPQLKNVPFKQASDIPSVKADESNYIVYAENNNIYISGIQQTATVAVYNLNGQLQSQSVVSGKAVLTVSGTGFFIVRITENDKTASVKVINK